MGPASGTLEAASYPGGVPGDLDTGSDVAPEPPSLKADVEALIADGKTYLEAELTFQKSRAGFTANRLKGAAVYGLGALALLHLALIALVVGLVIALTPLTGPWIATALVVGLLLVGALLLALRLRGKLADVRSVFEEPTP